jgi:hypothetical protein
MQNPGTIASQPHCSRNTGKQHTQDQQQLAPAGTIE